MGAVVASQDTVNAGSLNRRMTIQTQNKTPNNMGGFDVTWQDAYTCACKKENFPHGRGLFRTFVYAQLYPKVTATFQIRYQRTFTITPDMRVKYQTHSIDHFYQILGIENEGDENASMYLLCQEEQAKAVN